MEPHLQPSFWEHPDTDLHHRSYHCGCGTDCPHPDGFRDHVQQQHGGKFQENSSHYISRILGIVVPCDPEFIVRTIPPVHKQQQPKGKKPAAGEAAQDRQRRVKGGEDKQAKKKGKQEKPKRVTKSKEKKQPVRENSPEHQVRVSSQEHEVRSSSSDDEYRPKKGHSSNKKELFSKETTVATPKASQSPHPPTIIKWKGFTLTPNPSYHLQHLFWCGQCQQSFPTAEGLVKHVIEVCKCLGNDQGSHQIDHQPFNHNQLTDKRSSYQQYMARKIRAKCGEGVSRWWAKSQKSEMLECAECGKRIKKSTFSWHERKFHNDIHSSRNNFILAQLVVSKSHFRRLLVISSEGDDELDYRCSCRPETVMGKREFVKHVFERHFGVTPLYKLWEA